MSNQLLKSIFEKFLIYCLFREVYVVLMVPKEMVILVTIVWWFLELEKLQAKVALLLSPTVEELWDFKPNLPQKLPPMLLFAVSLIDSNDRQLYYDFSKIKIWEEIKSAFT